MRYCHFGVSPVNYSDSDGMSAVSEGPRINNISLDYESTCMKTGTVSSLPILGRLLPQVYFEHFGLHSSRISNINK